LFLPRFAPEDATSPVTRDVHPAFRHRRATTGKRRCFCYPAAPATVRKT